MSKIQTFGIVGGGEFGGAVAHLLAPPNVRLLGFDSKPDAHFPDHIERVGGKAVAAADVVLLAVPFTAYETVLPELVNNVSADTLIVDVCSVKCKPTEAFAQHDLLARKNHLMTHPLFGPQTVNGGVKDKSIVVTNWGGERAAELIQSWKGKGINILEMTADEHDREMAKVHALTFFIGRGLLEMDVSESPLGTGYFAKLMALVDTERHHSIELFETIQKHNPYAAAMRQDLLDTLQKLHDSLA